ncbi:hypothetical protein Pcinc_028114 [Petrolisthes cinctipes]|uniref:RING-type domain-containing protein n=1 Tax=Petrolisthes cinctipes TaxID=88211 RepID=A0AAE1K5S5_PETCI|nr:hypothetical protein Pcinc_028114 [Petrolisthes cinctipes]
MGDGTQPDKLLSQEDYRIQTYKNHNLPIDKHVLAKSGFYCTQKGDTVKCYKCKFEIDASKVSFTEIDERHKNLAPTCMEVENADHSPRRSKKFMSYDSLRFEKERLETFINWPVSWLQPSELARDGFYYLRTEDHCACVFCRGIVGSWEKGDTPRGEHQRHFPHCPFIKGQAVGNIPIEQSQIISRLSPRAETISSPSFNNVDVCGTGRLMSGSYPEKTGPPNSKNCLNLEGMGLPLHSGPKRRDYLTYESREGSFVRWPEGVQQRPADLAEAGFFYCGLSDHVRCFHCGNGLRNWESEDVPWEEHARWYPECTFVLLKRGQEFIDQVRRERPPYIRTQPSAAKPGASNAASTPVSSVRSTVSDRELETLMELDIIKSVMVMGFPKEKVSVALRRKLEQTGLPFFSLEACIEAILQYMEEESRQTLHHRCNQENVDEVAEEATEQQAAKMEGHQRSRNTAGAESTSSQASTSAAEPGTSMQSETTPPDVSLPSSSIAAATPIVSTPLTALPQQVSTMPSIPSSSSVSASSSISSLSSPQQESLSPSSETAQVSSVGNEEAMETEEPVPAQTITEPLDIITQANEVIGKAKRALKPSSGPPSLEHIEGNIEGPATTDELQGSPSTSGVNKEQFMGSLMPKELAEELERKRDLWMCKVCMDAEMEVVFLPCSHMVACSSCALALAQCPICRKDIKYSVKPILS